MLNVYFFRQNINFISKDIDMTITGIGCDITGKCREEKVAKINEKNWLNFFIEISLK